MNAIPGSCSPLRPAKPPAATQTGLAPRARPGVPGFSPERTTFRVDRTRNRVLRHAEDPRDLGLRQPILDQPRRQVVVESAFTRHRSFLTYPGRSTSTNDWRVRALPSKRTF